LASKGIRTSLVANSRKGWKTRPEDLVWSDKHGRFVDWRKVASAEGFKTGNKRRATKGDTMEIPVGIDIYEGMPRPQPDFSNFNSLPRQITLPVTPPIVQQFAPQPESRSTYVPPLPESFHEEPIPISQVPEFVPANLSEQQAQPVEEGLPAMGALSPPLKKKKETVFASVLPSILGPDEEVNMAPKIAMASKRINIKRFTE